MDDLRYVGMAVYGPPEVPEDWVDGAPTSPTDQSCALCLDEDVTWVHPLDIDKLTYEAWGKEHTLPSFWALCERCEQLFQQGDDDRLVALMTAVESDWGDFDDEFEDLRKPLAVFRDADRGARRFDDRS